MRPFAESWVEARGAQQEQTRLKIALGTVIASGVAIVLVAPAAGVLGTGFATTPTAVTANVIGQGLNLATFSVHLGYDGAQVIAISNELENARNGSPVLGQGTAQALERQRSGAIGQAGLDLVFVALSARNFKAALDTRAAARAKAAASSAAASDASPSRTAGAAPESVATPVGGRSSRPNFHRPDEYGEPGDYGYSKQYRATFGGDARAVVQFREGENGGVIIENVNRGNQPSRSGGQMIADSLKEHGIDRPVYIDFENIINEPTVTALKSGTPASQTVLGQTMSNAAAELGGTLDRIQVYTTRDGKLHFRAQVIYH